MDPWIPLNMLIFALAAWQNARRIQKGNPRNGLRWVAICICLYISTVYFLNIVGVIVEADIRVYLRWFLIPVGMYLIIEAMNG